MEALLRGTSAARNSTEVDEFFGIFSQVPVSLMDSARREEIFEAVSWFDRLLSVHDLHSVRKLFLCSAYALTLQRVDVLRTVSTHSPAFHHSGLSGEIARFGISHLCVDLVLIIGDCALQLRAIGKHIF